jgi:GntR family transcriptional regulator/MocR family aminotransferase
VPGILLDEMSPVPLYEQLYAALRDDIVRGRLAANTHLASTRTLAVELALSRFTVVAAIERLIDEGYLTSRARAGTFVSRTLPDDTMRARPRSRPAGAATRRSQAARLSTRGRALGAIVITGPRSQDGPHPFHPRRPALDAFPVRTWSRLVTRAWRAARPRDLDYGDPAGHAPLRAAIAGHIGATRGLRCEPAQVIVTSGAQQAFDMLFRILLDPGDRVWLEEPGYLDIRAALVGAGAVIVPVPMDAAGLNVAAAIARAPDARLAVVSPSHQYPTGVTLSAARRAELLGWARAAGAGVVEDDYDSYVRYRGRPVPALQRFASDSSDGDVSRVIYVGTFSKTMFPALRLGFCVVPEPLVDAAANARAIAGRNAPFVDQAALARFILDGHYDRHLRRARLIYQERYEAMQRAFERELGGVLRLTKAAAGTHVLGWFENGTRRARTSVDYVPRVSRAADAEGLVAFPVSRYCLEPPRRDGFVLGYGGVSPRQIASGAATLARVIERVRP